MNWGKLIVLVFVLFAGFIGTMVVRMSRERIDLVRDDYYQTEMAYQQQIDRINRTARLRELPRLQVDSLRQQLDVILPAGSERGTVLFYRPSDRRQDRTIFLKASRQTLSTDRLAAGFWRVKLSWESTGDSFYYEQDMIKR